GPAVDRPESGASGVVGGDAPFTGQAGQRRTPVSEPAPELPRSVDQHRERHAGARRAVVVEPHPVVSEPIRAPVVPPRQVVGVDPGKERPRIEVNAMPAQPPVISAMVVPPPRTRVEASAEIDQPGPPDPPVAVADDMPAGDDVSAGNVARGPSRRAAVGIPPRLAGLARRPPGGPV